MNYGRDSRTAVAGVVLAGLVLFLGLAPSSVSAQDMNARWLPWLGCWEAVDGGEDAPLLCIRPGGEGDGVEFVTWLEGEITSTESVLADGVPRNAEREDCSGLEEARFSDDGHRVYLKSNYVCEDGVQRSASGILAMVNPMEWVDIKAVEGTPWVLRYRLARASRVSDAGMDDVLSSRASEVKVARISASARVTEDDIVEAVGQVDAAAVEALVVERGDPFQVDADFLVRLADAGVPESVIDVVVAISYPDRFAVKAGPGPAVQQYADDPGFTPRRHMYMGYADPYFLGGYGYSPFFYGGYGYGYAGYGYSSYGYGGYGYGGYPYYRPTPIVVTPRVGGGSMIRGQGYTRGGGSGSYQARPRSGASSVRGGSRATSSPGVRSSGGSSAGRTAKPRSGGSGSVRSSSSGSGSKVRTAKPRGSGGGLL